MLHPRYEGHAAVIKNYVYLVGGDEHKTGSERLPPTGNWQEQPRMSRPRSGFATAVLADKLYVCGGFGQASVERFDPEVGVWELLQPMFSERSLMPCPPSCTANCTCVEVVGRGNMPFSSMERFDPTHDTWERLASMTHARYAASVVEIHGRLFMCCGWGAGRLSNLNSAEWFEPATGRWELLPRT